MSRMKASAIQAEPLTIDNNSSIHSVLVVQDVIQPEDWFEHVPDTSTPSIRRSSLKMIMLE